MTKIDTSESYNMEQLPQGSSITIKSVVNGAVQDEVEFVGEYEPGLLLNGETIDEVAEDATADIPKLEDADDLGA